MEQWSKVQGAIVQRALDRAYTQVPAIQLAILASIDGFQVATAGSKRGVSDLPEKFAAMASSMSALSEAAGKELGVVGLDVAVLDFAGLQVVLRKAKGNSSEFVLAIAASKEVILGNLLWTVRECAHSIEEALQ